MSESKNDPYPTGVYVKGDEKRVANSRSRAVALAFEGFKPESADATETAEVTETPAVVEPKADAPVEVADADKAPKVPAVPTAPKPAAPKKD